MQYNSCDRDYDYHQNDHLDYDADADADADDVDDDDDDDYDDHVTIHHCDNVQLFILILVVVIGDWCGVSRS